MQLEDILRDAGFVSERDIAQARALSEAIPFIDLETHRPERQAVALLPEVMPHLLHVLPMKKDQTRLWVAMVHPRDMEAMDELRTTTRRTIIPLLAERAALQVALRQAYASLANK